MTSRTDSRIRSTPSPARNASSSSDATDWDNAIGGNLPGEYLPVHTENPADGPLTQASSPTTRNPTTPGDSHRTCAMAWQTAGARLATAVGAGALVIRCGTIPKPDIELSSLAVPRGFSLRPAWRRVGRWRPVQQRSRDQRRSNTFGAVVGLRCGPIRVEFLTSWAPRSEEARAPCLDLGWTFTKPSESYEPVSPTSRTADWTRVDPSSGGVADRPSRLLKGEATCPGC